MAGFDPIIHGRFWVITEDRRVEVLKIYDRAYAREAFQRIDGEGREALAKALEVRKNYSPEDIPDPNGSDYDDFLWEELCEAAREDVRNDPSLYSFFVVSETSVSKNEDLYVSPDRPSAERFARSWLQRPLSPKPL